MKREDVSDDMVEEVMRARGYSPEAIKQIWRSSAEAVRQELATVGTLLEKNVACMSRPEVTDDMLRAVLRRRGYDDQGVESLMHTGVAGNIRIDLDAALATLAPEQDARAPLEQIDLEPGEPAETDAEVIRIWFDSRDGTEYVDSKATVAEFHEAVQNAGDSKIILLPDGAVASTAVLCGCEIDGEPDPQWAQRKSSERDPADGDARDVEISVDGCSLGSVILRVDGDQYHLLPGGKVFITGVIGEVHG